MKSCKLMAVTFFGVLFFLPVSVIKAQADKPLEIEQKAETHLRPHLLTELKLTTEQISEIRRINRENKPLIRACSTAFTPGKPKFG